MSVSKLFARITAAAAFAWAGGAALGADVVPPRPIAPGVIGAPAAGAPVIVESEGAPAGCATCQQGAAGRNCVRCGKVFSAFHKNKAPFPVTLCPGACFGYFQTQWRKWDDVCPYPYTGIGATDAGRLPGGAMPKGTELTPPRPVEPKMPEPKKLGAAPVKAFTPRGAATSPPSLPRTYAGNDLPPVPPVPGKFTP